MGCLRGSPLRRWLSLAYANGAVWGVASGLASVSLVAYFARELNARGVAIAWILAAPSIVGLSRLLTPLWLHRVSSRRRFTIGMFLASAAAMGVLPIVAAPGALGDSEQSLAALGGMWMLCQALEFIGVVSLWSWFGDLVPAAIRGRFVGRREAWLTAGMVTGGLAAAIATWAWQRHCQANGQPELLWKSYAACASFGAAFAALATLPLARMNDAATKRQATRTARPTWRGVITPLVDPRFRRFMLFGICYSVANGLVQSPRQILLANVLKLELAEKRSLDAASRGLQIVLMPWLGNLVDRRGNVPVLVASWAIVSLATVFFLFVTPAAKWWIVGAYICWVAYAGLNVVLPNLMLGLSPPGATSTYAAAWFAWTQLAYSLSILAGGRLFDWLAASGRLAALGIGGTEATPFRLLFGLGGLLMVVGVGLATRVREPSQRTCGTEPPGT